MLKVIVDKIEGNYVVCEKEDKSMMDVEIEKVPKETKEGDVLIIEKDKIHIDKEATLERKKK